MKLLVGDNPFQGVSHLSQTRAVSRTEDLTDPGYAARLISSSIENSADGFMFTFNSKTIPILRELRKNHTSKHIDLYALIPDAGDFVRIVAFSGGVLGLGRKLARDVILSNNWRSFSYLTAGILSRNPGTLLKSYLAYEAGRLRSTAGNGMSLASLMLHETLCDMSLALNLEWVFHEYISIAKSLKTKPGFETRNLPYLVNKFEDWRINLKDTVIAAPLNAVGFQMCPSKEQSEMVLSRLRGAEVIAFSVLAAGYIQPEEALNYISRQPEISGVAIGISSLDHAMNMRAIKQQLEC